MLEQRFLHFFRPKLAARRSHFGREESDSLLARNVIADFDLHEYSLQEILRMKLEQVEHRRVHNLQLGRLFAHEQLRQQISHLADEVYIFFADSRQVFDRLFAYLNVFVLE